MAKVDPYLRPLYDALYDMLEPEAVSRLMERGTIEVAPLAYMRGRTLNDSFIILDEAQNTTGEQMKMFLTRLGFGSKAVVTGDVTQIDLPEGRARSGLLLVRQFLEGIPGLQFVELTHLNLDFAFDTGHAHMNEGVETAFQLMKDKIRSTHVHDNDSKTDTHIFPMVGEGGTIDWKNTMQLFRCCDGQFPLLLELKERPEMAQPLDAVREVFDKLEQQ